MFDILVKNFKVQAFNIFQNINFFEFFYIYIIYIYIYI